MTDPIEEQGRRMERDDVDTFDRFDLDGVETFDDRDWPDLDHLDLDLPPLDDDGADLPPPDDPGPSRPPRPTGPGAHDAELFSGWMTLVVAVLVVALVALQLVILGLGARGGQPAVYACTAVFGLLFLGPFVVGSIWFDRLRRSDDT